MTQNTEATRYIGMDIHKQYAVIGGVDRDQDIVLKPRRVNYSSWGEWIHKHLRATDEVVIEATGNTWRMVDDVQPLVARVVVAHPRNVKLIAAARVKTDKVDVLESVPKRVLARSVSNLVGNLS